MKREFLEGLSIGEGITMPRSAVDAIMAENGRDIEAHKAAITSLTTERDGLRTQLEDANRAIRSYRDMDIEGVKKAAADWEMKYNADTRALKEQLEAVRYGHAVEKAVEAIRFSSESARRAFVAELNEKKLPVQDDGGLLGLEEFTKTYQEADPGAFAPENAGKVPVAVRGARGGTSVGSLSALRSVMGLTGSIN